ncbi:MAG: hypothetical protein ACKO2K_11160, partial [Alphaproteobacteria bacterium]
MLGIAEFAAGILDGLLLVLLSIAVAAVPFGTVVLQATRRPPGDPGVARTGRLLARAAVGLALCQAALLGIKVFVLRSYLGAEAVPLFAATPQARAGLARLLVAAALGLVARRIAGRTDDARRWSTAGLLA